MSQPTTYLHMEPESEMPKASDQSPMRVVVIAELEVPAAWQAMVSTWLVRSGCLYMMAWGSKCSSWDDSVDIANLQEFDFNDVPEERFVMTTWHEEEPLAEVFWFSKNCALHPTVRLERTVLLHIAARSREQELLASYAEA